MAAKRRAVAHAADAAAQQARPQSASEDRVEDRVEDDRAWGWYLYGITGAGIGAPAPEVMTSGVFPGGPVEALAVGDLVAFVQRVPIGALDDALAASGQDVGWLEELARRHHDVIAAIHGARAILPAKFGAIYVARGDLTRELERSRETLRGRLARVEGHDEWAVRIYVGGALLRVHAAAIQPEARRLEAAAASATPGRAYLLRRKLADQRGDGLAAAARDLAARVYDRLAARAADGVPSGRPRPEATDGEIEVLRAAFLVPRDGTEAFIAAIATVTREYTGVRIERSGPWPPYSFAGQMEGADA